MVHILYHNLYCPIKSFSKCVPTNLVMWSNPKPRNMEILTYEPPNIELSSRNSPNSLLILHEPSKAGKLLMRYPAVSWGVNTVATRSSKLNRSTGIKVFSDSALLSVAKKQQ